MNAQETIKQFLEGQIDIHAFRKMYDEDGSINDYLQGIIDEIRAKNGEIEPFPFADLFKDGTIFYSREGIGYLLDPDSDPGLQYCPPRYESVRQMLNYEFRMVTHDVRCAQGASLFYNEVLVIYYQIDRTVKMTERYGKEYDFALEVIPDYLSGGEAEAYIQKNIIPLFPESMGKTKRKKAVKSKIREEFRREKGYPCWIQHSEWPMGKDGKPTTYVGKGKSPNAETGRWIFRDETDGELITVEQFY